MQGLSDRGINSDSSTTLRYYKPQQQLHKTKQADGVEAQLLMRSSLMMMRTHHSACQLRYFSEPQNISKIWRPESHEFWEMCEIELCGGSRTSTCRVLALSCDGKIALHDNLCNLSPTSTFVIPRTIHNGICRKHRRCAPCLCRSCCHLVGALSSLLSCRDAYLRDALHPDSLTLRRHGFYTSDSCSSRS